MGVRSRITPVHAMQCLKSLGMTMLEVVMVLGVLGLLAGVALTQVDTDPFNAAGEAAKLKTALRYAQSLAFAQAYLPNTTPPTAQVTWGINVNNNSYRLVRGDSPTQTDVNLPGQTSPTYNLPGGVSLSTGTIYFNFRGIPSDTSGTPSTNDTSFTVTAQHKSESVMVREQTGFIP